MIRYSFNTWNHSAHWGLPPSLPAQIEGAATAGYDHVGLDVPSLLAHEEAGLPPRAVADLLQQHEVSCYELVPLSVSDDRDATEASLSTVRRLAADVGSRQVLGVVRSPLDAATVATTRRCVAALADAGVGLSIEFLPTNAYDSIDAVRRLIDAVGHPELRVVVDTWHFFEGPSTWEALEELPLERLGFVQFSDAAAPVGDDLAHEYRQRRVLPGEGVHDLAELVRRVRRRTRDVTVSVEVLSAAWRARPPAELAAASYAATRRCWEAGGAAGPEA